MSTSQASIFGENRRAIAAMILGMLLWAVMEFLGTFLASCCSAYQVVWVRYGTHLAILTAVVAPRGVRVMVVTGRGRLQVFRGLLMLVMPVLFIRGVRLVAEPIVWSVFWVVPILSAALAAVLLHEHVPAIRWAGAGLTTLGSALFLWRDGEAGIAGVGLALGMGLTFALYIVLTRMLRGEKRSTNLFYTAASVFIPLTLLGPAFLRWPGWTGIALMALIGALGLASLYLIDVAMSIAAVSVVAPIATVQVVWTCLLQIGAGSLHLTPAAVIGITCILLVVIVFYTRGGSA
jgi:drug/metabolite transporter (DMT)-like permease